MILIKFRPEHYLYEFYNHRRFKKFKKIYKRNMKDSEESSRYIKIGTHDPKRKVIFLEIIDTIVSISKTQIQNLPVFCHVGKKIGKNFGLGEFYIYLRPFTFGFLNLIKQEYDIAIYSSVDKALLIFLMDVIQGDKEFFNILITHETDNEPKSILKFMTEGRSHKNTILIDHDPKVLACYNSNYSLPIPKFTGIAKDSTL